MTKLFDYFLHLDPNELSYDDLIEKIKKILIEDYKTFKLNMFKHSWNLSDLIDKFSDIMLSLNPEDLSTFLNDLHEIYKEIFIKEFFIVCKKLLEQILQTKINFIHKINLITTIDKLFGTLNYDDEIIYIYLNKFINNIRNEEILQIFLNHKNIAKCTKLTNLGNVFDYIITLDNNHNYILNFFEFIQDSHKIFYIKKLSDLNIDYNLVFLLLNKYNLFDITHSQTVKKIIIKYSYAPDIDCGIIDILHKISSTKFLDTEFYDIINLKKLIVKIIDNSITNKDKILSLFKIINLIKTFDLIFPYMDIILISKIKSIFNDEEEIYHFKKKVVNDLNYKHYFKTKKEYYKFILIEHNMNDKIRKIKYLSDYLSNDTRFNRFKHKIFKFRNRKNYHKIITFLKNNMNTEMLLFNDKSVNKSNFIDTIYEYIKNSENYDKLFMNFSTHFNMSLNISEEMFREYKLNLNNTLKILKMNDKIVADINRETCKVITNKMYNKLMNSNIKGDINDIIKYVNVN
jgi:hypothetical protein